MGKALLSDLTDRARNIFCTLVEAYLETGNPIGARPLAKRLSLDLSPATVRNVMQDLEEMNLLASPHTSAGRLPSEAGLRLFVDALLELGLPPSEDSGEIVAAVTGEDISTQRLLANAGRMLSGLSRGASLVLAPTEDKAIDHAEFIRVGDGNALVALAMEDGSIENRLFDAPPGMTPSSMQEAANFLNAHLRGCTLSEARSEIARRMEADQRQIDSAARRLVEAGMASWEGVEGGPDRMIVRGLSNLLENDLAAEDLDQLRSLLDDLERRKTVAQLLDLAREGQGVRVFIGSENPLFSLSGSSLIISPYMNGRQRVLGALAVIGPTRLNYGRVVPAVSFTAELLGQMLETGGNTQLITEDR